MTNEERYVVNPLKEWFKKQPVTWELYGPDYGTSATGWDIEARRKNLDLLIEAKFFGYSFISSFNGLVTAPLVNRPQHFIKTKDRSWCYNICWAVGTNPYKELYQQFFDYLSRSLDFWDFYHKNRRLKYIFFVKEGKVAKVPFKKFLELARDYNRVINDSTALKYKRQCATELTQRFKFT